MNSRDWDWPSYDGQDPQSAIRELFAALHFQPFVHIGGSRFRPAVCEPEQRGVRLDFVAEPERAVRQRSGDHVLQVGVGYYAPLAAQVSGRRCGGEALHPKTDLLRDNVCYRRS